MKNDFALVAMQLVSKLIISASLNVLVFSVNETLYQLSLSDNVMSTVSSALCTVVMFHISLVCSSSVQVVVLLL